MDSNNETNSLGSITRKLQDMRIEMVTSAEVNSKSAELITLLDSRIKLLDSYLWEISVEESEASLNHLNAVTLSKTTEENLNAAEIKLTLDQSPVVLAIAQLEYDVAQSQHHYQLELMGKVEHYKNEVLPAKKMEFQSELQKTRTLKTHLEEYMKH